MIDNVPKFEVGDFAKNQIHGYITFLYGKMGGETIPHFFFGVCVSVPPDSIVAIGGEGVARLEISSELTKVPPTLPLIAKAKEYLLHFNTAQELDNLSYIELLAKLNEKEKELKLSK
jgi:hypothetical protein